MSENVKSEGGCQGPGGKRLDSANHFAVGVRGDGVIVINRPVIGTLRRDEALNLAAWLAVLADPVGDDFAGLSEEIQRL